MRITNEGLVILDIIVQWILFDGCEWLYAPPIPLFFLSEFVRMLSVIHDSTQLEFS